MARVTLEDAKRRIWLALDSKLGFKELAVLLNVAKLVGATNVQPAPDGFPA